MNKHHLTMLAIGGVIGYLFAQKLSTYQPWMGAAKLVIG